MQHSRAWNAGRASLFTSWRQDRTVIAQQYSAAPLQWLGPLDPLDLRPVFYLRNPNGGLLQGDVHSIDLTLAAQTQLEIRSQSATRLHPGHCQQSIRLRLQDHSTLIWIPHPLIPGAGTIFRQQTQIEIAPTARLAFAEIWTAGRIGMQEVWQFQQVTSDCQIWCRAANTDPHPLIWERLDLHFPHTHVQSDGILGPYTCWGSLYLLGDWDIPVWPWSATQWSMPIPPAQPAQGWILRQVGDQADLIWQRFRDLIRQLCLES